MVQELTPGMECPACGCGDTRPVRDQMRCCQHCGTAFHAAGGPPAPAANPVYRPAIYPSCPRCGHHRPKVTSTRRPLRHHKCGRCGFCFKSREIP